MAEIPESKLVRRNPLPGGATRIIGHAGRPANARAYGNAPSVAFFSG